MQTPSMGVREPHCSISPGAVGGFAPDIHGAQGGGFNQWRGANTMKCAVTVTDLYGPLYERTVNRMGSYGAGETARP